MSTLAILILTATPAFDPVREHSWGEPAEVAFAIEAEHTDSEPTHLPMPVGLSTEPQHVPFLHYTFRTTVPFEFVALNFEASQLASVLYPLHLPSTEKNVEKPATDVPEKFQAVRAWLTEHLGEPDVFTTSVAGRAADFSDVESLLEIDAYLFNYTWCSKAANAYLIALREMGEAPVVVASLSAPGRTSKQDVCAKTSEPSLPE